MKIWARFRRRALLGEKASEINRSVLKELELIHGFYNSNNSENVVVFNPGTGESSSTNLTPLLSIGISGAISYASRLEGAIVDKAISDDSLRLEIDLKKIDYQWVVSELFEAVISAFRPYRACVIEDLDSDLDDFDEICRLALESGRDIDGRDSIFRIHQVSYYDDELCLREFRLSSKDIASRLEGKIELTKSLANGVLLAYSRDLLGGKAVDEIDTKIRELIAQ